MSSLKTFLYEIANNLQVSPASLYERQRELVRHGLLPVREGRGPGSGVPLTPGTLATFLIGLLGTDSLTDLAKHTAALCLARAQLVRSSKRSKHTLQSDLSDALVGKTGPLDANGPGAFPRCTGLQITRHWRGVLLEADDPTDEQVELAEGLKGMEYLVSHEARLKASAISHTVSVEMEPFWDVCLRLQSELRINK